MSEDKQDYVTEAMELLHGESAAQIHPPKTIKAVYESGLKDYKVWGWVKISSNFIYHIKKLRGAKLAIWQVIALSIDENGECRLTIKELKDLTGYSHTEVIESLKELDEMGYLSIDRSGKKNLYQPEFAARGIGNEPSDESSKLSQETLPSDESTPPDQNESSPARENLAPTSKELKELKNPLSIQELKEANDKVDAILEMERKAQERKTAGKAWRGRELLVADAPGMMYCDWWHAKTGLEMYGAKGKPKLDTGWTKASVQLYENEITLAECDEAYTAETWDGKRKLTDMMQIVKTAKAIHAAGPVKHQTNTTQGEYRPRITA